MITPSWPKSRNRADVSTKVLARQRRKQFDKSSEEIQAAVARTGDNAETVTKD